MMDKMRFFLRRGAPALTLGILLTLSPATAGKVERGLEPKHQPVVERTDFVFDVVADSSGALSPSEQKRLSVWFKALGLGYGDHVSLAGANTGSLAMHDGIAQVVGREGLLIEGEAPATVGEPAAGAVRVVVSRSVATVPGCPSWRDKGEADFTAGLSDNYGCATASNLAAMIADPQDLVQGHERGIDDKGVESGKAIKAYKDKAPTGAGGLQAMSAGGS
ncbi:CpaD family pilus assembly lipoprotein [Sphingobium nicotianae]|uniref:Pilus assembly protein CpaD n=1 Tax=Sphingobium nicotianae TaxID=2782607 RepID=A0A9X1IQM9_9SPHN|nr:CpaD family pilus assembly lipoprotein [Sphingobium nicotianae]MBT2186630.1 pilus assembly protein CpaD [Sphingobium nicotianae]